MTNQQFIDNIASYIKKYAPQYGIKVYSPIIAQACLESGYGTSELAIKANNFFGIKYHKEVSTKSAYVKVGSEQLSNGTYTSSVMQWSNFSNMEDGVKGYFNFLFGRTGITRYNNLKGVTDPKEYLDKIKEDGYATSLSYVDNLMNVIKNNNLTKFDVEGETTMDNSVTISYKKISPNKTSPRNHAIDTITIHCMAGNFSVEKCGDIFAPASKKASSNYGIGSDGRIAIYVEEKDRSWASSNAANDHRAVTIEVANDGGAPDWHVSDAAMTSLIKLCADICKRNNIKQLIWSTDKNTRIKHLNGANMTVHRDFAAKACPGDYLYNKHGYIAQEVNKILAGGQSEAQPAPTPATPAPAYSKTDFIKEVQKALGVTADGIAGSKTLAATVTVSKTKNNKHAVVKPLQKYLNSLGYNCGTADGVAGAKFDTALKAYQSQWMTKPDGEATTKGTTWSKLLGLK